MSQDQVAVFHPGTQHSWQTARALQDLGQLAFYATSICYDPGKWPYKAVRFPGPIGAALHREFSRFDIPGIDPGRIRTHGWQEWGERMAARAGLPAVARLLDTAGNRSFAQFASKEAIRADASAIWGYDNCALEAFAKLNGGSIKRILDVTIAPRRVLNRIMAQLHDEWPQFFVSTRREIPPLILKRTEQELALADTIVVGSPFVRDTIISETPDPEIAQRIRVLPYCFDEALFAASPLPQARKQGEPVKFLFVGSVGPRKGAHLLLEAFLRIPEAEAQLTLLGSLDMPSATFTRYSDRVTHINQVPRSQVPAIMAQHDALVLPSFFEGSAITLLEALASGLALIQSQNAGLGGTAETGFVLDQLTIDALEEAILTTLSDRERLLDWRHNARQRARDFTYARYRQHIASLLAELGT
ncbi:glycosyltransferase family 4 protein [Erythrobacter mangrovi]|uniref:Glycosyltransferase family 4 protein n=1 Tax=Erythrobacter mangrovi TaxID=2739433 RepID=A0A7D4BPE9_9SPHN|nr:glycosyltransferase family 4 protein [Erythrobacter mangrovi]QKG71924.1 glycosyltransferase family 4 protein [Erythrobacter mangrovi]